MKKNNLEFENELNTISGNEANALLFSRNLIIITLLALVPSIIESILRIREFLNSK